MFSSNLFRRLHILVQSSQIYDIWHKHKFPNFFPDPSSYHIVPHITNNIKSPMWPSFLSPYFDCAFVAVGTQNRTQYFYAVFRHLQNIGELFHLPVIGIMLILLLFFSVHICLSIWTCIDSYQLEIGHWKMKLVKHMLKKLVFHYWRSGTLQFENGQKANGQNTDTYLSNCLPRCITTLGNNGKKKFHPSFMIIRI